MQSILITLSLSCLLLAPSTLALADDGPAAINAFRAAHAEVTALVDAKASTKQLQREVDALLDYDWIAQAALGGPKHYAERCAERCAEFEARITALIRRNYLDQLQTKTRGKVEIVAEHVRESATKIDTKVSFTSAKTGKTKTIGINYVMHRSKERWQIRDIITDGVSLAKTYKYEINKLYKAGGMDEVVATLEAKVSTGKAGGAGDARR